MRRMTAMAIAAAFALFTANTFAQAKPDFSGKWTREAPAGGAAAGGGGGGGARGGGGGGRGGAGGGGGFNCGMSCTITVTGVNMKIDRAMPDGTALPALNFKLDGTDSTNMMAGRGGGEPVAVVSKAKWDGNKIVITTERTGQDGTKITATQTLSIDAGKLTVSTSSSAAPDAPAQVATYTKG